jgi:glycosyltransferase involved in cell wall biosynthesis
MRGGEVQTLGLIRGLRSRGTLCALAAREGSPLLARARAEEVPVIPWRPRGEMDVLAAYGLRRWVAASGAQVVHAHTAHALGLALLAVTGMRSRPKVVASRRVSFPLRSALSLWKYRRADAVVAVCGEIREGLLAQGVGEGRVWTIHSGVELARFQRLPSRSWARERFGIPADVLAVGAVGAMVEHKGHRVLLEAIARLRERGQPPTLVLAGEGPLRGSLAAEAQDLGVNLKLLGYVEEPAELFPALDVLALASLSGEGSPGVIKEAAAAGVAVVATDVSGTSEILRNEREALIVVPGSPEALATALNRLLGDLVEARRLSAAARARIEEFSMDRMAQAHHELYRQILAAP